MGLSKASRVHLRPPSCSSAPAPTLPEPPQDAPPQTLPVPSSLPCSLLSGYALSPDACPVAPQAPFLREATSAPEAEVTSPLCSLEFEQLSVIGVPSAGPSGEACVQGVPFKSTWAPPSSA